MAESGSRLTPPVGDQDHVAGGPEAPVTLVEYGDYECPNCGIAYPIIKTVRRELGSRLRFVFRNLPLAAMHPHARQAAQVAEAAAAQGKFWAMHDMLFEHQSALEEADLMRYAELLELDTERIARELQAMTYAKRVSDHFRSGILSGANGSPTFFVNGVRYDESWMDDETFIRVLRDAARLATRDLPMTADA
jgi:protein-disulfide isomerase